MQPAIAPPAAPDLGFARTLLAAAANGRKSERTRARLQAAACRLLEAVPPRDLKVADICAAADVAHGTFYVYFRDIRHLLADTLTGFVGFVQDAMRRAARGPEARDPDARDRDARDRDADRIRSTTAAYVALFEQNAGLMRCLVSRLDDFPEAAEAFETLNRQWAATVVQARLRRLAGETEPDGAVRDELLRRAYALGAMVDQYLIALLFGRDETLAAVSRDRAAVVETLSLIWERGLVWERGTQP